MTEGQIKHGATTHNAQNPLAGAPMQSVGEPDVDVELRKEQTCPFIPLGFSNQHYHLLTSSGELVSYSPTQLEKASHQAALVHGDVAWFVEGFVSTDARQPFDRFAAYTWIMKECHEKGFFDPAQVKLRKAGVWRVGHGDTSSLLLHQGNKVHFEDEIHSPGYQREGAYYLISQSLPAIADRKMPASVEDCQEILEVISTWSFTHGSQAAHLWFGWLMAALYGGAPDWRVHMMISAQRGGGKSWLARLVDELTGGLAQFANDATEAGIRQAAEGRSGIILYDEAEDDDKKSSSVGRVVELIRRMSGGVGAVTLRGSAGGKSSTFVVSGVAYLTAILPPVLEPQDKSRFIQLDLGPLATGQIGVENEALVAHMFEKTGELSPRLRRRAYNNWGRFRDSIEAYREAFAKLQVGQRDSLRFATVLAGRDVGLYDEMQDGDYYDQQAMEYMPWIESTLSDGSEGEGMQCLNHALDITMRKLGAQNDQTVGEQIGRALGGSKTAEKHLSRIGLKIIHEQNAKKDPPGLLVANRHPQLEDVYAGTKWHGRQWQQALRYIDGAEAFPRPMKFAGSTQRCMYVPITYLPEPISGSELD